MTVGRGPAWAAQHETVTKPMKAKYMEPNVLQNTSVASGDIGQVNPASTGIVPGWHIMFKCGSKMSA
jgi:hypothetical protein